MRQPVGSLPQQFRARANSADAAPLEKCRRFQSPERLLIAIHAKKWRFIPSLLDDAPAHGGVYALWRDGELVHLGCAHGGETIRDRLLAHRAAGERASHYSWEIAADPKRRAWEVARELERPGEPEAEAQPW